MASVRQRAGTSNWYACITVETPEGRKQKQFSTGLNDKAEALAVATAAERAARRHQGSPHQLRAALDKLAEEFTPAEDADPAEWLERWALRVAATVSPATARAYKDVATETAAWLRAAGVRSFTAVTGARLTAMRDDWRAGGNSPSTCNTKMKRLAVAWEAAKREKLLAENPARTVDRLRVAATKRREFRPEELSTLLASLTGEWRALVLLGYTTGQRLNDLAELTWNQADLEAGTLMFHTRKTDALVALPILPQALDALLALPATDAPRGKVFPDIDALGRGARSNHFRELLAGVGLHRSQDRKARTLHGRASRRTAELCFHSLRHTATSALKSAGVADSIARAIVGHESAAVSRVYTHLDIETLRAALQKLPTV
jgi:integrase